MGEEGRGAGSDFQLLAHPLKTSESSACPIALPRRSPPQGGLDWPEPEPHAGRASLQAPHLLRDLRTLSGPAPEPRRSELDQVRCGRPASGHSPARRYPHACPQAGFSGCNRCTRLQPALSPQPTMLPGALGAWRPVFSKTGPRLREGAPSNNQGKPHSARAWPPGGPLPRPGESRRGGCVGSARPCRASYPRPPTPKQTTKKPGECQVTAPTPPQLLQMVQVASAH